MKALGRFCRDERGMAPYSILGISMLLIVSVAIYHFNNVDIQKAQERNALTMDMETFYSAVKVGQDLHQVARVSAENVILEDSMATYGEPVDVYSKWGNDDEFNAWKDELAKEIAEEAEKEIFYFYFEGDAVELEKRYYSPSTDFDFANFIKKDGIEVSVTKDSYDDTTKTQKSLELTIDFKDGGLVKSKNKFTGYEMTMTTGTNVSVNARPFTMADKAYEFTSKFNKQEEADNLAWTMWGVQTVLGLFEANVKRDVKYATDDRVSYSLMHLLVAYEELETFGTFDYVHTTMEFLRPWIGAEGEATEFLSLLSLGMDESYVDQAIESMDVAEFVHNVSIKVQDISNSMIIASSYLDSNTVTKDGVGFEKSEVRKELLSCEGTVQHLENTRDTQKLDGIITGIETTKSLTSLSKDYVTSDTVNMLSVSAHFKLLEDEYTEVRTEWMEAKGDFKKSQSEITSARNGYSSLSSDIENEICTNPIAAMLWFGDANQDVKGFREILQVKIDETDELLGYYGELENKIDALNYEPVKDSYDIDRHYTGSSKSLNEAKVSIQNARAARNEYLDQKYKHDHCYRHIDWKDPQMGSCLGSGYSCEPYDCNPYDCNCVTETDEDGSSSTSCDTCWRTCYLTCYDCICDKRVLKDNYEKAEEEYIGYMESTEENLETAATEVQALQTQIDAFFTENDISGTYSMIDYPVLFSIYDGYYYHWNYTPCSDETPFPGKKYECANKMLVASYDIDETNYHEKMPKSPLTYDVAHRDYNNYGLYYVKYMIDRMDETFGGSSINADELAKGKAKLDGMKDSGFFAKINAIIKPIKDLVDVAGDIKSGIAKIKNAEETFPNIKEHFYTTLPLPPFNGSKIGFENQGFSVIHDIRLRADTSPGEIKVPIIGTIKLGFDNRTNPSLPIPYTPINVFVWQFDITPSFGEYGTNKEPSTLWLLDTENSLVAPLMEMETKTEGVIVAENFNVPLYLHKPTMYKYKFTPNATISKKISTDFNKLPPVFIMALGPFKTRFGPYVEPPDKYITDDPVPIDVYFDREFSDDSATITVNYSEEFVFVKTYVKEVVNGNTNPLSDDIEEISIGELELAKAYGWSEVKADTYAVKSDLKSISIGEIYGEDHARVYFINPELESIEVRLERTGPNLKVINNGNKKIDVSVDQKTENSCLFIFHKGNMSNSWIGSVKPRSHVDLAIAPENNVTITAKVLMPEKVEEELERRGIPLKLKYQT